MILDIKIKKIMGKAHLAGFMGRTSVRRNYLSGAVLLLAALSMAAFAQPGFAAKLGIMKERSVSAILVDDAAALERLEAAKVLEERLHWGRKVAKSNPSLSTREIHEIGRAVVRYSNEYGLSPNLIVAVIKVESSGRVGAVSPKGAQGLMQVMPFWKSELGIEGTLFEIDNNIRAGAYILSAYIKRHGYKEGIARYYRGSLNVDGEPYYEKVHKAMQA